MPDGWSKSEYTFGKSSSITAEPPGASIHFSTTCKSDTFRVSEMDSAVKSRKYHYFTLLANLCVERAKNEPESAAMTASAPSLVMASTC